MFIREKWRNTRSGEIRPSKRYYVRSIISIHLGIVRIARLLHIDTNTRAL